MHLKMTLLCLFGAAFVRCLPTVYKYNDNKMLEPDLIPVSSTVIPLPVYQVGYGVHVVPSLKDEKVEKPEGPITLVTVHNNKKKAVPLEKPKPGDLSSVKEVSKKDFDD